MIFALEGFAHGFQTLADSTGVFYQMSQSYVPDAPEWASSGIIQPLGSIRHCPFGHERTPFHPARFRWLTT